MGLVYHDQVIPPPRRQVLRFRVGEVGFALPLVAVREIVPVGPGPSSGEPDGAVDLGRLLAIPSVPRFALLLAGDGPRALLVTEMRGVGDLASAEAFRLPEGVVAARPAPFRSALRFGQELDLELVPEGLAELRPDPVRDPRRLPDAGPSGRELLAERAGARLAVPLPLVVQVLEGARLFHTPLGPPAFRGLLHHGRAIHPAWDAAGLLGDPAPGDPRVLLLLDAGGATAGVLVDRVVGLSEGGGDETVRRPPWDVLLAPAEAG
jgi:chemotaxis signal transduction protein